MNERDKPIGEILVKEGLVEQQEVDNALDLQKKEGGRLCYNLIKLGYVTTRELTKFLQNYFGFVPFRLDDIVKDKSVIPMVPAELANYYKMVPIKLENEKLHIALAEDSDKNQKVVPALEELTGYDVQPVICPGPVVSEALDNYYGKPKDRGIIYRTTDDNIFVVSDDSMNIKPVNINKLSDADSEITWLRGCLAYTVKEGIPSVELKMENSRGTIEMKTDEESREIAEIPESIFGELDSRIRDLAKLEKPGKDGTETASFRVQFGEKRYRCAVTAVSQDPYPEIRLKLKGKDYEKKGYDKLKEDFPLVSRKIMDFVSSESGALLVVSPFQEEGKNLIYTILEETLEIKSNIFTVEKEIKTRLQDVSQRTFRDERRVGEIIDSLISENADILAVSGIQETESLKTVFMASSKVPVFVFLPAYDAYSALNWIREQGLGSALKAEVLEGILAVRNIDSLCKYCAVSFSVEDYRDKIPEDLSNEDFYTSDGCKECMEGKYLKKQPVLSLLEIDDSVKNFLEGELDIATLKKDALQKGHRDLFHTAVNFAAEEIIDMRDVIRMVVFDSRQS